MKYAVKFFKDQENPMNVPGDCVVVSAEIEDNVIEMSGYSIMTSTEFTEYQAIHDPIYQEWLAINNEPRLNQSIRDGIDNKTGELISEGFIFQLDGKTFRARCNDEDQRNYTGLIISKDFLEYTGENRVKLKGYDLTTEEAVYANFSNSTEVMQLYGAGVLHVNSMLNDGWKLKDLGGTLSTGTVLEKPLKDMTYAELVEWIDPRA